MNLRSIAVMAGRRSKFLILSPESEWEQIVAEKTGKGTAFFSFALPWCVLLSLAAGVGYFLFESRLVFAWNFLFYTVFSVFLTWMIALFGAGWLTSEMAPEFGLKKQPGKFFVLYAYSLTPTYFAGMIVFLFPELKLILMLGLYSLVLMYKGTIFLFHDLAEEKRIWLIAVSCGLFLLFYTLFYTIFHSILTAMAEKAATVI
ncbi:MAG: Yip1 family protein [Bacteroidales bacterium]|nr:Yip1 family protein [Bacteroidales bacterium]